MRQAQATPLVVNGVMYVVTAHSTLVALDPDTGKQIWVFSHQHNARPLRGIAYWPGGRDNAARLLFGTGDGFLLAVDAKTGQAIPGFGNEGEVDLKKGMKEKFPNVHYGLSGAPIIYKNLAIVGSHTPAWVPKAMPARSMRAPARWCGRSTRFRSPANPAMKPG